MPHEGISITIDPNDPESIRRALNTEWLLTNGLGGYAMGTVLGVNTRRYHGLLVAATKPPVGRIVALHSMIEQLIIPKDDGTEEVVDLSTQQFVGSDGEPMLHPSGWQWLNHVLLDRDSIAWTWRSKTFEVHRRIELASDENRIRIKFGVDCKQGRWRLLIMPVIPARDFHSLNCEGVNSTSGLLRMTVDFPHRRMGAGVPIWRNFAYAKDRERGQDWTEDIQPFQFEFDQRIGSNIEGTIWVASPRRTTRVQSSAEDSLRIHDNRVNLYHAAAQFVVERHADQSHTSVIAGYPWFGDWGRDTMISLPGLMLCTKRYDEARSCLTMFAQHIKNGLIPNLFDDYGGAAHYNTVDASLWFVHAVHEYWKAVNEGVKRRRGEEVNERRDASPITSSPVHPFTTSGLVDACRSIIAAYRNGTDFNIRMDDDGLISAGDGTTQLTWMDAKRDGVVFTPRYGQAVEINALWFNALCCLAEMTEDESERQELLARSRQAAESFRAKFWWQEKQCLHDVLLPTPASRAVPGPDDRSREAASGNSHSSVPSGQLRPNQIFAVSLPFSPLTGDQQRAVVKIVGEQLLTPFGLRTLDRDDPNYRGRYEGNMFERDRAYHNGTVWPWLIGPYCEALLRVNEFSTSAKRQAAGIIQPLIDEMSNATGGRCLGQIAEIYDGDPPHLPNGCPAQAWSVAEVLRITHLIEK